MRCKVLTIVFLLAVWQIAAFAVGEPKLLPGVIHVVAVSFPSIGTFGGSETWAGALSVLLQHSAITLARVAVSLPVGMALGTALALLVHYFRSLHGGLAVVMRLLQAVPLFALIPLFLQWFGGRETGVIVYIVFAVSVVASTNAYNAIRNIRPEYVLQARLNGASRFKVFATVHLPAVQPELVASFRTILGFSWAFALGAEYLTSQSGLGYLVFQSYLYSDTGKLIVFSVFYGLYGVLIQLVSEPALRRLRKGQVSAARVYLDIGPHAENISRVR